MRRAALAAGALAVALPATAEDDGPKGSPTYGTFQLSLSGYRPRIDAEFGGAATPYATTFGNGRGLMFRADVAYTVFSDFGSLDVGVGGGYWEKYGKGQLPDGRPSGDRTARKVIPSRG